LREGISKAFFFEKKKQKTFDSRYAPRRQRAQRDKSFLVLFFKKAPLSFYITLHRPESLGDGARQARIGMAYATAM